MAFDERDDFPSYYRYWGKADRDDPINKYHLLPYHCLDVAAVGKVILDKNANLLKHLSISIGLETDLLKNSLLFFLALHDLGKFSESFQFVIPKLYEKFRGDIKSFKQPYSKNFGHDSIGFLLWKHFLFKELINHTQNTIGKGIDAGAWKDIIVWLGEAAFGHHGLPAKLSTASLRDYFSGTDKQAVQEYVEDLLKLFPIQNLFQIDIDKNYKSFLENFRKSSWSIAGFFVLCDWIGSGLAFPYKSEELTLDIYWEQMAFKKADEAVEQAGILPCISNYEIDPLKELLNLPGDSQLTPLQDLARELFLTNQPQLFIIEDETGAGKTEASLILLNRLLANGAAHGFYLALPTMATADGIFSRIQKAYTKLYHPDAKPSLILSHSSARLSENFTETVIYSSAREKTQKYEDDAESRCQAWLADNRKKTLLAHAGVGTIDQAFLAVLKAKYQSLRLIGLVGKILIIDEAHAYDAYMGKELEKLLEVHAALGGSAIVMSATLPFYTRQKLCDAFLKGLGQDSYALSEIEAYPLLTCITSDKHNCVEKCFLPKKEENKKKRQIKFLHSEKAVNRAISESLKSGKCVCWIRNSVRDARQSFDHLSTMYENLELFHARLTIADRLAIQARVLDDFGKHSQPEQRKGKLLIATQVVEQSLDLDFDVIISDLAPIDLILQRAGRLHRHLRDKNGKLREKGSDDRGDATLYINTPELDENPGSDWFSSYFPNAKRIYENHARLWLGLKQLNGLPNGQLPKNIRDLIEKTYDKNAYIPDGLKNSDLTAEGYEGSQRAMGRFNTIQYEIGYSMDEQQWPEDINMPTRLGEETMTLTLARWQNGNLLPFNEAVSKPWQQSEIRVLKKHIYEIPEFNESIQNAVGGIKQELPGQGKWINLLPMVWNPVDGIWEADIITGHKQEEKVYYHKKQGLMYAYEREPLENEYRLETEEII